MAGGNSIDPAPVSSSSAALARTCGPLSRHLLVVHVLLMAASVWCVSGFSWGYVSGDPLIYFERMRQIAGGAVPYLEAEFEHLPVMLIPMTVAWLAGGSAGPFTYRLVWVVAMTIVLLLTTEVLRRNRHLWDRRELAARWVLVSAPLIPIALFRTEPVVVLLAVLAIVALARRLDTRAGMLVWAGVLAKGWPLALAVTGWLTGRRRWLWAGVGIAGCGALAVLSALPGFSSGRAFEGLHSESVGGALWGLWALVRGGEPELLGVAGAAYVDAPLRWTIPGLLAAVAVAARAVAGLARPLSGSQLLRATGALVGAGLLASPLQSTQFLLWLSPFLAASSRRSTVVVGVGMGLVGLVNLVAFDALLARETWWFATVVGRHSLLLFCSWRLADEVRPERRRTPPPATPGSNAVPNARLR